MQKPIKQSTVVLISIVCFVLGVRFGTQGSFRNVLPVTGSGVVLSDPEHQADISQLWSTWNVLNKYYIAPKELTAEKLIQSAAAGLVAGAGDPYTQYFTKKEGEEFDESLNGHLEGIGAQLELQDGLVVITHPLKESPAERAGLLANDVIGSVNGEDVTGWKLEQVVAKVRGPKGTQVTLIIYRKGEVKPLTFTITRDEIRVPSVESHVEKTASGSVGVLALRQFGENSLAEVRDGMKDFMAKRVNAVVIDLRGNGGGYLEGAVGIASLFLKEGVVVTVERRDAEPRQHNVTGDPLIPFLPLAVLIDGGSASASEILAGALQDHHRATVVGTKSFGKGTVQEIYELPNGDSVKVTVARWITPNGKNLGKEGVHPDLNVEPSIADLKAKKDVQLQAALKAVFEKR